MADVPTNSWDETKPADGRDIALGDDDIREFKTQVREVIAVDHKMESTGQAATWGRHNKMTLIEQADLGTGAEGVPILGAQTADGKAELTFTDEDDEDIQISKNGKLCLDDARLSNDTNLIARNNADDDNINMFKVNSDDVIKAGASLELSAGGGQVTEFSTDGTLADDSDSAVPTEKAVKTYVDATVKVLGDWVDKTSSYGAQQATTDGFVVAYGTGGTTGGVYGCTDGNSNPTTVVAYNYAEEVEGTVRQSIMFPVKKDDYWKVGFSGLSATSVRWIPLQ